jgi:hypothetical protein
MKFFRSAGAHKSETRSGNEMKPYKDRSGRHGLRKKGFGRISIFELGRPRARMGNPNTGIPEVAVIRLFDVYGVAPGSAMGKLKLFSVQIGGTYNFNGVTAFQKGQCHTNLVQAGMLESSYSYEVRAFGITTQALQGQAHPLLHPEDAINYLSSFNQININRKWYFEGIGVWIPSGGGVMMNGIGTLTAPTSSFNALNGLPLVQNVYELPGGQYIGPQENFDWIVDPTQNAGGTPSALAAAGFPTGVPAAGLLATHFFDGTLQRVAQ